MSEKKAKTSNIKLPFLFRQGNFEQQEPITKIEKKNVKAVLNTLVSFIKALK